MFRTTEGVILPPEKYVNVPYATCWPTEGACSLGSDLNCFAEQGVVSEQRTCPHGKRLMSLFFFSRDSGSEIRRQPYKNISALRDDYSVDGS